MENDARPRNTVKYLEAQTLAHERLGDWSFALCLLEEMLSCGLAADVITYNAAMSACEKGNLDCK